MANTKKSLSENKLTGIVNAGSYKIGIVVSEWNEEVTEALYSAALATLVHFGVLRENIIRINTPGSFELPLAAQQLAAKPQIDAVICLGCVIQGETKHFDFICNACAQGIMEVSLKFDKPVAFGVLTTNNLKQALDRAGGKFGNKGDEAAVTVLKMLEIK